MTTTYTPVICPPSKIKSGALTTLAAIGAYNSFIVCDPEKPSFPGQSFARHTNFAVGFHLGAVTHAPIGSRFWDRDHLVKFSFGAHERAADLIGPTFFHCYWQRLASTSSDLISWVNELGNAVVNRATFLVGNQKIEEMTGEALHCLGEFGIRGPGLHEDQMLGKFDTAQTISSEPTNIPVNLRAWSSANRHTYTPLNFHFCHRKDEYFPLVSVQYQAPEIHIQLRGKIDLIKAVTPASSSPPVPASIVEDLLILNNFTNGTYTGGDLLSMDIGYSGVYLDTDERRARANRPYSYVFEYIKCDETVNVNANTRELRRKVTFENASSAYWWFYRRNSITRGTVALVKDYFDFSTRQPWNSVPANSGGISSVYTPLNPFACARILVNNNVRASGDGLFFYQVNPYIALANRTPREPHFINSFDFGMNAAQWNYDNGSQNDSQIDNLVFEFTFENSSADPTTGVATNDGIAEGGTVFIYATKFSVAKISGGQYGLAFSTV